MNSSYFFITLLAAIVFGYIGKYIAKEKNRDKTEGFLFGFFLSILGLIIIGLLPTKELQEETKLKANDPIKFKPHQSKSEEDDEKSMFNRLIIGVIVIVIIIIMFYNS